MTEIYKDVIGYEGLYKVSNTGKVFSLINNIVLKTVKYKAANTEYEYLTLVKNKVKATKAVHRLVALAFIENPNNKPCVNHIDNNGLNNAVDNLEWCTYSENLKHAQKQGRLFEAQRKGGLTTTKIAADAAKADALSMVGKIYGKWKLESYAGFLPVGKKGIHRHKFHCLCQECGTTRTIGRNELKGNSANTCRVCDALRKTRKRYEEVKNSLIGTTINNWHILEITAPVTTIATCKLRVKCNVCGSTTYIPYTSTYSNNKTVKKCNTCKG